MAGKQQPGRTVKSFEELVNDCLDEVEELFPWDLEELLQNDPGILILDIREPYEFDAMHIRNSVNVPRGVLESACEYDYEETVPELVEARETLTTKEVEEEFGDLMFVIANLARHLDIDPEAALRATNAKFTRRFEAVEDALAARGKTPDQSDLQEMDALWDAAKHAERED